MGVYYLLDLSRGATEHPEKVNAVAITESLFHTLNVKPCWDARFRQKRKPFTARTPWS